VKHLGEGQFANVYSAIDREHPERRLVAIKKIKLTRGSSYRDGIDRSALREIKLQKELDHENVMGILDVFGKPGSSVSLVFQFMATDLKRIIDDKEVVLTPAHVKCILVQTFVGLDYLHQHWILHRDLKPENLLLDDKGVLKIADFGLAKMYGSPSREMTPQVVTQWYKAPELLIGSKHYTTSIDVWAMGCIVAEMVLRIPFFFNEPPFSDIKQLTTIFEVTGTPGQEQWPDYFTYFTVISFNDMPKVPWQQVKGGLFQSCDEAYISLIESCLTLNPLVRCTCKDALQMEYFTKMPYPSKPIFLPGVRDIESNNKGRKRKRGGFLGDDSDDENSLKANLPKVAKKLLF